MFRPSFNKGSVLKQNMLEALRDYPCTVLGVEYSRYGDGIISGFEVSPVSGGQFQISPGILKANGEIYISSELLTIEQKNEKHYVYLTIQKKDNPDGTDVELKCEQKTDSDENGLELFRYTKNAEMYEYKDISELFNTPMNRINQIFCKFSTVGGNTLHPNYYRLFAEAVLGCTNATACDVAFAYQCLNGINNIDVVKQYFKGATSNIDILKAMKKILDRLSKNSSVQERQPEKIETPRKMVVS